MLVRERVGVDEFDLKFSIKICLDFLMVELVCLGGGERCNRESLCPS